MKIQSVAAPLLALLVCAACSQPPASVVHKGDQFYGRNSQPTQLAAAAPVEQMSVRDVSPQPLPAVTASHSSVSGISDIEIAEPQKPISKQIDHSIRLASLPEPQPIEPEELSNRPIKKSVVKAPAIEKEFDEVVYAAPEALPELAEVSAPDTRQEDVTRQKVVQAALDTVKSENAAGTSPELDASHPFIWPVEGKISSRFGPKNNGLVNDGINIEANEGQPIWAAASGEVVYAGNELKGYGNMLILRHEDGWMTAYAHASDMLVGKGERVKQGDLIGYVGKTGAVNKAQLHFGIRKAKDPVDPETLLPKRVASR